MRIFLRLNVVNMSNPTIPDTIFPFNRAGGILLHPTSLPSKFGIGDLGLNAYKFIDFLKKNKFRVWQILPLGPTGYGNSPYQCFSAFAGNPYLISIEQILQEFNLQDTIEAPEILDNKKVNYGEVIYFKMNYLKKFFTNYFEKLKFLEDPDYIDFKNKSTFWLDDYALFMSLKEENEFKSWTEWDQDLKLHSELAIQIWSKNHSKDLEFQKFIQYLFFNQWNQLKEYAKKNDITIVGDIPIYVALDSSDVWSNQNLFLLENGHPTVVAGVPPDFFSKTGQLWGNPIYDWTKMKKNGFKWWLKRISQMLEMVDIIRVDHFRGFEAYWEIPGEDKTAENGKWVKAPGKELFQTLKKKFSPLPVIAEDLGVNTSEVNKLRHEFSFPGMKILQMAFGDHKFVEDRFLPHNIERNSVSYTGTHDNLPICGWWEESSEKTQKSVLEYFNSNTQDIISNLIRAIWSSRSVLSIIPMQDLLRLGSESRMNLPATLANNWEWRFQWDDINENYLKEIVKFTELFER